MTQSEITAGPQDRRRRRKLRNDDWLFLAAVAGLIAFVLVAVILYNR